MLISRMQANADQVERDILETQKKLQQVKTESSQRVSHEEIDSLVLNCPLPTTAEGRVFLLHHALFFRSQTEGHFAI